MDTEILKVLYENENYLYYLRMNPKWYKILMKDTSKFKQFKNELNLEQGNTFENKIERWKTQFNFINSLIQYAKK